MRYTEIGNPNETLIFFGMCKRAKQTEGVIILLEYLQCVKCCSQD